MRNLSLSWPLTGLWGSRPRPIPSQNKGQHHREGPVRSQPGGEWQGPGSYPESSLLSTSSHSRDKTIHTVLIPSLSAFPSEKVPTAYVWPIRGKASSSLTSLFSFLTQHTIPLTSCLKYQKTKPQKSGFGGLGSSSWPRKWACKNFSPPHVQIYLERNTKFAFAPSPEPGDHQERSNFALGVKANWSLGQL